MLILSQLLDGHSFRREFGRVVCFNHVYVLIRGTRKENVVLLEVLVGPKVPGHSGSNKDSKRVSQAHEQHSGQSKL